jgi:hypothetical protein
MAGVAVVSRGVNQLDVFGLDGTGGVSRNRWDGSWHGWESLGTDYWIRKFAVASWDPSRLDVIGIAQPAIGQPAAKFVLLHKAWTGSSWSPSQTGWINRGGDLSPDHEPVVAAWAPNRLDIFAIWSDLSMYHKSWTGSSWSGWSPLGGEFKSGPAVASWGPNRLDVFGLGKSLGMYHKAWMGDHWHPANPSWQGLGGQFGSAPEAVAWGPNRLDIFAVGGQEMQHKAWNGSEWKPSLAGWKSLGGQFQGG